jgi:uncharacterized protein YxeA
MKIFLLAIFTACIIIIIGLLATINRKIDRDHVFIMEIHTMTTSTTYTGRLGEVVK